MSKKCRDYSWPMTGKWPKPTPDSPPPRSSTMEEERAGAGALPEKLIWRIAESPKPRYFPVGARTGFAAICIVESITGEQALCRVDIGDACLPVAIRASLLRRHHLREGMKFIWWMREGGEILAEDIDPEVAPVPALLQEEEEEYQARWEAFRLCHEAGEALDEHTGDGP